MKEETLTRLELRGAGGEPVDLWRALVSHGLAFLPPATVDEAARTTTLTLPAAAGPRTVRLSAGRAAMAGRPADALVTLADPGPPPTDEERRSLTAVLQRVLCLNDDLSGFYARAARDPRLAWACSGSGRLLRSPTVFEDLVKIVCTTNCTWSATVRMVTAMVTHLGAAAPGAAAGGAEGRAFPTPAAVAGAGDEFFRDVARAGYRGPRLRTIAAAVAAGDLDLEGLLTAPREELPDDEVERRLLELPGVGPYAAAHLLALLGRHSRLILDSWTRPKYARLLGRRSLVPDTAIERRFRRYREFAGLAFWLVVTRDWVDEEAGTGIR